MPLPTRTRTPTITHTHTHTHAHNTHTCTRTRTRTRTHFVVAAKNSPFCGKAPPPLPNSKWVQTHPPVQFGFGLGLPAPAAGNAMLAWAADITSAEEQRFLRTEELNKFTNSMLCKLCFVADVRQGDQRKGTMVEALKSKATVSHLRQAEKL